MEYQQISNFMNDTPNQLIPLERTVMEIRASRNFLGYLQYSEI